MTPPTAEGGALRSQDLRTTAATRRASTARSSASNPATGAGAARQPARRAAPTPTPAGSSPTACATRSASPSGPARTSSGSATSAGTTWEEIDRIPSPTGGGRRTSAGRATRAPGRQAGYDSAQPEHLREPVHGRRRAVTAPYYTYPHSAQVVPGETCPTGSSSISGLAFYDRRHLPGAATTARSSSPTTRRNCIWVMLPGANGAARPGHAPGVRRRAPPARSTSRSGPAATSSTSTSNGGTIRRIRGSFGNPPPTAVATATPDDRAPRRSPSASTARGSSDPDGDTLTYAWDLDGDGQFDDSTVARRRASPTPTAGIVHRRPAGDRPGRPRPTRHSITITAGNAADRDDRHAGGRHDLEGRRHDHASPARRPTPSGAPLPASALSWQLDLHHCTAPSDTATRTSLQSLTGVGRLVLAPDHEYPSYLELRLTATDARRAHDAPSPAGSTRRPWPDHDAIAAGRASA